MYNSAILNHTIGANNEFYYFHHIKGSSFFRHDHTNNKKNDTTEDHIGLAARGSRATYQIGQRDRRIAV